jgi:hypothetical protein
LARCALTGEKKAISNTKAREAGEAPRPGFSYL